MFKSNLYGHSLCCYVLFVEAAATAVAVGIKINKFSSLKNKQRERENEWKNNILM